MTDDVAGVIRSAREALKLDLAKLDGEILMRGTGTAHGIPARFTCRYHGDGRFVERVDCRLGQAQGFDGSKGWSIDHTGLPGVLDLEDLEIFQTTTAVTTGCWALPNAPLQIVEIVEEGERHVVLETRVPGGDYRFRLWLDRKTWLPAKLQQVAGFDRKVIFRDYRPGGWGLVPHEVIAQEGWLEDSLVTDTVEHSASSSDYSSPTGWKSDTVFHDGALPIRATRSPRGHLPMVRPTVNGRDVGWFALDTGASLLGIEERVADTLDLPSLGRAWIITADGGAGAPFRFGQTLELGSAEIAEPIFIELDLDEMSRALGVRLAGILGYDLFARMIVKVGAKPLEVEVFDPATFATEERDWRPLRFENRNPVLECCFEGGEPLLMPLDTGSSAQIIFYRDAVSKWGMDSRGRSSMKSRGLTGTVMLRPHRLPWFEMGGLRFENPKASLSEPIDGVGSTKGKMGSVGWGLLKQLDLVFDYPGERMSLGHRSREPRRDSS